MLYNYTKTTIKNLIKHKTESSAASEYKPYILFKLIIAKAHTTARLPDTMAQPHL